LEERRELVVLASQRRAVKVTVQDFGTNARVGCRGWEPNARHIPLEWLNLRLTHEKLSKSDSRRDDFPP